MSARNTILKAIKQANTSIVFSNETQVHIEATTYDDKIAKLTDVIEAIGGEVVHLQNKAAAEIWLHQQHISNSVYIAESNTYHFTKEYLYHLKMAVIHGTVAVAENGAVWVTEKQMGNRILPFAVEHLVIAVEEKNIVNNMHEAYATIQCVNGYAAFIAGPSKTADIEQSLVIGAHGPKAFTLIILKS